VKEGTVRKCFFMRGEWRDSYLYSIHREEWKEPKILAKNPDDNNISGGSMRVQIPSPFY